MAKLDEDREWLNVWPSFADIAVCAMILFLIYSLYLISMLPQQIRIGELTEKEKPLFATGRADLSDDYKPVIDKMYEDIIERPEWNNDKTWVVVVKGHTDNVPISGKYINNWELSSARALSVVDYLTKKGIPEKRIRAIGYGEHDPEVDHRKPTSEPKNRRIEVMLFKSDGRL
mgnify:CR=1 FL=1|jgi:flagellar motor protein MotB